MDESMMEAALVFAIGSVLILAIGIVLRLRYADETAAKWEVVDQESARLRSGQILDPTAYDGEYDGKRGYVFFHDKANAARYLEAIDRLRTIETCDMILKRSTQEAPEPGTLWLSAAERAFILDVKKMTEMEMEQSGR